MDGSKSTDASVGTMIERAGAAVDGLKLPPDQKTQLQIELQELVRQRDAEMAAHYDQEAQAKQSVIAAELAQGDEYTKRARPTVVYAGLVFIFIDYVVVPLVTRFTSGTASSLALPSEFW